MASYHLRNCLKEAFWEDRWEKRTKATTRT
ncbi:hypothetical protein Nmel_006478 [Mimus melanotis]